MTESKPTLSLCMIVKNEEQFLEQCLSSIKDFVDEMIIVDTGSTDNTINIAKRFTNSIYSFNWCDDFSKARNESLRHAAKEWILVLDADELLTEKDIKKIHNLIENSAVDAYFLTQRNYSNDSSILEWIPCKNKTRESKDFHGYKPNPMIRLFKNRKDIYYENKIHEVVDDSIKKNNRKIVSSDIQIHHYDQLKSNEIRQKKLDWHIELGNKQIENNPANPRAYYQTGVMQLIKGNYKEAIERFEKALELNPGYKSTYYNLGEAYHKLNHLDKAEQYLKKSIKSKPEESAAYNSLAIIYQNKGMFKESIKTLLEGLNIDKNNPLLYQTLGGILFKIGKIKESIVILNESIKLDPCNVGSYNNLGGAYAALKQYDKAIGILTKAINLDNNNPAAYKNLALVYLNKGDKEKYAETMGIIKCRNFPSSL